MNRLDYKKLTKNSGIYRITNTVNDKCYIGSAVNIKTRIRRHLYEIDTNTHANIKLKRAFDKYGISKFELEVLEEFNEIEYSKLLEIEKEYILKYDSINNGYNLMLDNSSFLKKNNSSELMKITTKERCSKKVVAIDRITGTIFKIFNSITEAANYFNTSTSNISRCCKGVFKYIKGHIFCYEEDYDINKVYKADHWAKGKMDLTHKANLTNSTRERCGRKVFKYNLNMKFIEEYPSIRNAEIENNLRLDMLRYKLDKNKIYENYYWFSKKLEI